MSHTHTDHNHAHHHSDLKGKKLGLSILLNILITIAQVVGGLVSGSLSLLSDAMHNFSDVVALVISYIADRLTKRKFTAEQTFGYKRAEIIAALINAASLIAISALLVREAILRFNNPLEIDSTWVIVLAAMSILVNGGSVLLLKKESKNNMNMKSAYLHLLSDMITSVAVLAGGVGMYFWKIFWIDSALSLLIAVYLIYSSIGLLVKTLKVLMQFAPSHIDLEMVKKEVNGLSEVDNIHHMHLWQLNDNEIYLEAHVDFDQDLQLSQVCSVMKQIRLLLRESFNIHHTTLQPEYGVTDSKHLVVDDR